MLSNGKKLSFNSLAKVVSEREGGKVNLSIAQIKEVLRITREELGECVASDVLKFLNH